MTVTQNQLTYDQVIDLCKSNQEDKLHYEDFCTGVTQTLSGTEGVHPYPKSLALTVMKEFIEAGNRLDQLKKALFYGKNLEQVIDEHRTYYSHAENKEVDDWDITDNRVLHGVLGMATEDVELVEALVAALESNNYDMVNIVEELGDSEFYKAVIFCALAKGSLDTQLKKVWATVLLKLNLRYQGQFSQDKAINRDLDKERTLLESRTK